MNWQQLYKKNKVQNINNSEDNACVSSIHKKDNSTSTKIRLPNLVKPLGQPQVIAVKFDHDRVGRNSRAEYPGSTDVDSGCVHTEHKHTQSRSVIGAKSTPDNSSLISSAGHASFTKYTVQLYPQIVVSMEGIFKPGMGHIALSRVTSMEELFSQRSGYKVHIL